jgi:hypothetical protein
VLATLWGKDQIVEIKTVDDLCDHAGKLLLIPLAVVGRGTEFYEFSDSPLEDSF